MTRITSSIFSIYIATLLFTTIPYVHKFAPGNGSASTLFWDHLGIFAVFFCLAFFVLGRHISSFAGHGKLFLSVITLIGLLLAVFYRVIPIAPVYTLPAMLTPYFATDAAFTAWLLAPLVVLFF